MNIGLKIKGLRENLKLTRAEFSRILGEKAYTLQNIERGKQRVNDEFVVKLITKFDVDPYWLFMGSKQTVPKPETTRFHPQLSNLFSDASTLPLIGLASCSIEGWGKKQPESMNLPMPTGLADTEAFYVRACGQSMIPEGIHPGDICLVTPQSEVFPGDRVWIKEVGGKTSIKRFVSFEDDGYLLRGWMPPADGMQKSFDEIRMANHSEIQPIEAVFDRAPKTGGTEVKFIPDPRVPSSSRAADVSAAGDYRLVNLHDVQASAGFGALNGFENVLSSLAFSRKWLSERGLSSSKASLIYVKGDSMEPTLLDGSVVLIDHNKSVVKENRIYAFREGDELFVKRLVRLNGSTLSIGSDNPAYPSRILTDEEISAIHIIGEVVWMARNI